MKVAFQRGELMAWVLTAPGPGSLELQVFPTGCNVDTSYLEFVDTAVSDDLVWHVFRRLP